MSLVMELVAGKTLEASRSRFGDLAWALPVLKQVAEALASMHARHIVHRDLKPGNILLDGSTPKVTDFGIASLSDAPVGPVDVEGATQMTMGDPARTGAILGTPLYMAPELTAGSREAKPSADLWAFGVRLRADHRLASIRRSSGARATRWSTSARTEAIVVEDRTGTERATRALPVIGPDAAPVGGRAPRRAVVARECQLRTST